MTPTKIATGVLAAAALAAPAAAAVSAPAPALDTQTQSVTGGPGLREKDMIRPLVVAHRGASGYRPEHTLAAYELAVGQGADYIEPDLVMTRDGVLVDRHEPEIGGTTDVAQRPEFADRRTTKLLDGVRTTGWFVDDFTLAELKTLRATERLGELREESAMYDGRFEVPTFEEVLRQREELSRRTGRVIGVIPEIKHSTYLHAEGFDPEREVARLARKHHLDHRRAPLWVQSFELTALKDLREQHGFRARTTFLTTAKGGPFDLSGRGTTYAQLTTPAAMKDLSRWIDGYGPEKSQVIPRRADGSLGTPTTFVRDAHAVGLTVMPWTFRAENSFLPTDYRVGGDPSHFGRAIDEARAFLETDVDGIFCDQPDVCVQARTEMLHERG
ncbi:glycerophosphodiester phosphodiesterase family protein [Janibacter melonis]|uniref:glycerophosphodiester phosphodiesterase family protein n=1 Tax=Janibacter melonis TaxID=262209 RepID=UPI00209476DE|nr:glycerophosphodiester phosphodiesterase family protein [Janibacter melonis]